MSENKKKTYTEEFKIKVANASYEDGATLKSTGDKFNVNPTLVRNWRIKFSKQPENNSDTNVANNINLLDEKVLVAEIEKKYNDDEDWDSLLKDPIETIKNEGPSYDNFTKLGYALNNDYEDELLSLYCFRFSLTLADDEMDTMDIAGELGFIDPELQEQISEDLENAIEILDKYISKK